MLYDGIGDIQIQGDVLEIPISDLPNGVYVLEIQNSGLQENFKFVK